MTISGEIGSDEPLYLDDLQVGQRFTSKTHVVDEAQIKAFARQFDPQPFHLDDNAAKHRTGTNGCRNLSLCNLDPTSWSGPARYGAGGAC